MIEGVHFVRVAATERQPIRWYVYAWRGGPRIMTAIGPSKPKLTSEALTLLTAAKNDARQVKADTIAGLARQWRGNPARPDSGSPEWRKLAATTKATWGLALDLIEDKWGKLPLEVWNDPRMVAKVVDWRDSRAATPRAADIGVTVLSRLLDYAMLRAKIRLNVAERVPAIYDGADRAEIIWTPDDMERAKVAADKLKRPEAFDAIELATLTGFRRADLVAVTFEEVGEHAIIRTAGKKSRGRRRRAVVPLLDATRALLERLRSRKRAAGITTLLVNSLGRPWTPGSLTQAVNQVRDAAGIIHPGDVLRGEADRKKHLHDCRGTFVTHLCRAGATDEEIARTVAWSQESVSRIRRTYVDDASTVVAFSRRLQL